MPLNADYIRNIRFPVVETTLTDSDVMFYALSIGLGKDPMDERELRYVYEQDLQTFPTMPVIIGHPGNWMVNPETGITRRMVVHGAQRLTTNRPLPVGRPIITTNRVTEISDKGDKGAVLVLQRETCDKQSGDVLAINESSVFCRADGNFGGQSGSSFEYSPVPERAPDRTVHMETEPNMALFYRLNNDRNPLHADPAFARKAGFDKPILHGLATYGIAAVAIARAFPERTIRSIETRFSRPAIPGDTVSVDMWEEDGEIAFRARIDARDVVVLDRGRVAFQ